MWQTAIVSLPALWPMTAGPQLFQYAVDALARYPERLGDLADFEPFPLQFQDPGSID